MSIKATKKEKQVLSDEALAEKKHFEKWKGVNEKELHRQWLASFANICTFRDYCYKRYITTIPMD